MGRHLRTLALAAALCVAPLAGLAHSAGSEGRWQEVRLTGATEPDGQAPQACTVWRNDCEACDFHPDGTFDCSTPGIACVPESWSCMTFTPAGADGQPPG